MEGFANSGADFFAYVSQHLEQLNRELSTRSPLEIIRWLQQCNPANVVQFTSFGFSGMVIMDCLFAANYAIPTVFLDTLFHFPETLELRDRVVARYNNLQVITYKSALVSDAAELERVYGAKLWETQPNTYDYITKIEPTVRALDELNVQVWITGRRRSQGSERADLQVLEITQDGRIKVNPTAFLSWNDVINYLTANNVPYNQLLHKGYKSVGDTVSTVPTLNSGERSGRWSKENRTECGIHHSKHYTNRLTNSSASLTNSNSQAPTLA